MKEKIFGKSDILSDTLFKFGDSFNLTKFNHNNNSELFISNDTKAISQDWIAVGKEVDTAIARFERENGIKKPTRELITV